MARLIQFVQMVKLVHLLLTGDVFGAIMKYSLLLSPCGGIGIRGRLRACALRAWWFESTQGHLRVVRAT